MSIADLIRAIGRALNVDLTLQPGPLRAGGTPRRCPDVTKLEGLGYKAKNVTGCWTPRDRRMVCGDLHAAKGANVTDVVPAWLKPNSLPDDVSEALHGQLVFVTGANGFLGRHVCASLHSIGARLLTPSSRELDLTHQEQVEQFIATHRPQHVVHLAAACGGIGANVDNPGRFLYENALMGLMLLDACRRHDVTKFALISTTCAYPKHARLPSLKINSGTVNPWEQPVRMA